MSLKMKTLSKTRLATNGDSVTEVKLSKVRRNLEDKFLREKVAESFGVPFRTAYHNVALKPF